jgi:hypothetical protein
MVNKKVKLLRIDVCDLNGHVLATASKRFTGTSIARIALWRHGQYATLTHGLAAGRFRVHVNARVL